MECQLLTTGDILKIVDAELGPDTVRTLLSFHLSCYLRWTLLIREPAIKPNNNEDLSSAISLLSKDIERFKRREITDDKLLNIVRFYRWFPD
jgi:hypothetical protein